MSQSSSRSSAVREVRQGVGQMITASSTAEASDVNGLLKASWAAAQRRALSVVRRCRWRI